MHKNICSELVFVKADKCWWWRHIPRQYEHIDFLMGGLLNMIYWYFPPFLSLKLCLATQDPKCNGENRWKMNFYSKLWWTDETDAMSLHGTLEHSSRSKIKDVFFVYLCISLMRYETAMWMEWDQFTSSVWRVVSVDFSPYFIPLQ